MTKKEICVKLGISGNTFDRWVNVGLYDGKERKRLKAGKIDGKWQVEKLDFNDFVKIREGLK